LPEGTVKVKTGSWVIPIDGKKAKMGFLYQYLTASRVAEVFGKYRPQARHCFRLLVGGENAVLFIAKSGKRKTKRGWLLRPVLLPSSSEFEPLVQIVYDHMKSKEFDKYDYPFSLHENPESSKRYAEAYGKQVFEGLKWRHVDYSRSAWAHPSLGYHYDLISRKREQLTESEYRSHGDKITFKRELSWIPVNVRIDPRWRPISTQELRILRLRDLEKVYDFESKALNLYAGWKQPVAQVARHYTNIEELELDIDEDPNVLDTLAKMGKTYFKKLQIPIDYLLNPHKSEHGGIKFLE
jgi:hypothetical protein